jgi:hypothetical protein
MGGIKTQRSWTAEEDAIVLKMKATAASKRLKWRTRAACNTRRNALRHPEPKRPLQRPLIGGVGSR